MGILYEYFSRKIFWEPFKLACYGIFLFIIILYLFNPPIATLTLFGYIALWSRIPCLVSDWTKDLDMIDFFAVVIALNLHTPLAGLYAGLFSVIVMLFSRIFGPDEDLIITFMETVAFFIASVLTPVVFSITGSVIITLFTFTVIRYSVDTVIAMFVMRHTFFLIIFGWMIFLPIAFLINKTMMTFLGPFFTTVFDTGLKFNFPLFLFAILLTFGAHYIPKYFKKREVVDKTVQEVKRKERSSEGIVADDNYRNYPQFYT